MSAPSVKHDQELEYLRARLADVEQKLAGAEELLQAIRRGEVDAVVVEKDGSPAIYTLKSASEPYRLLIEQMAEGALTVSENDVILYCNEAFSSMIGRPRERLIGQSFSAFAMGPSGDAERLVRNEHAGTEIVLKTSSGAVPAMMSSSPVKLDGGVLHCVVVTDLSRQGLRILHEAIVEYSADAIYAIDTNGTILSWNAAAEDLHGFTAEEAIGSNISLLIPQHLRNAGRKRIQRVFNGETLRFDTEYVTKSGGRIHILVSLAPIQEHNGHITGAAVITRDITERQRAEQEVISSRTKLEAALRSMTDSVFISDVQGNFVQINDAFAAFHRFPGVKECPSDITGLRTLVEMFSIDGQPTPMDQRPLSRALRGETATGAEYAVRRMDTGETWIGSYSFAPIRDQEGRISGSVVTARDITEHKADEARLRMLNEELIHVARVNELSQVSAGIAHELNQPLAALLNYAGLAKRMIASQDPNAREKAYAAIARAGEQAERAGQIIRRMRDFVEKRESNRKIEDINTIVADAVALGLVGAAGDNITIIIELAPDLPPVLADRVQIEQVLVNLLRNAAEAMSNSAKREIRVSTTAVHGEPIFVTVADTGPGVSPKIADRLFQPFVSSKPGGMGIGLSISRSIVESHGGHLEMTTGADGGAVFHFTLPAVQPA